MSMQMHEVSFQPDGVSVKVPHNTTLMDAAAHAGIILDSVCGAAGTCNKCAVELTDPPAKVNACQYPVDRDLVVTIPEASRFFEQKILQEGIAVAQRLDPFIGKNYVTIPPPSLEDLRSDANRLIDALPADDPICRDRPGTVSAPATVSWQVLQQLPSLFKDNGYTATAVTHGNRVFALEPGDTTKNICGLAVDIGTTTVVANLMDLTNGKTLAVASAANPQITFGADVISRILYMQESPEKRSQLQKELVKGLNQLLLRLCRHAGRARERIFEATVVGNTTMLHSLLGLDALHIAVAPYVGGLNRALCVPAGELGLQIHPRGRVYILPSIASFVGADTVAVILATKLYQADSPRLAIDIGTNGEVMLATRDGVFTASTAAGPAFEGGRIKYGMRAVRGAVSSFQAVPSLDYTVIGGAVPRGICGSGLIDLVAELFRAGVLDRKGRLLLPSEAGPSLAAELATRVRARGEDREFVIFRDGEAEVTLTQQDVRELQLAKGAMRTGIELLMKEVGIGAGDIQETLLSGVFGNYINREKAVVLGLIPPIPLERIHFIGNGAMDGALRALINMEERTRADEISVRVRHIELSGRPDFEETFLRHLALGE